MPADHPAEPEVRPSLLTDPAAQTRVLREGEPRPAEPAPSDPAPIVDPAPAAGDVPAPFGPHPAGAEPNPFSPGPHGAQPAPYLAPQVEPMADLPAGLDADELAAAPGTSARRGKLRRRVAFLRAARELLLRDLGGFVYELHRTAHDIEADAHRRLRETKLAHLTRVDAELHELEVLLDDVRRRVLVREPGVGGECAHCGELFGSAAHYCSHCGNPLTEAARRELAKAHHPAPPAAEPESAPADQPTQEIDPEFEWPPRADASTPVGEGEPATTVQPADESQSEAPRDDATPAGDGEPATAIHADGADTPPAGEAPGDDATPAGEGEPGPTTPAGEGDAEPTTPAGEGETATTTHAADDATPTPHESPRDGAGEASAENGSSAVPRDSETWRSHDDPIFSPVERHP